MLELVVMELELVVMVVMELELVVMVNIYW